jgi:hypothetical protein
VQSIRESNSKARGRSIDQEIAHPRMTTGNPILRNLDRSRESWQRNCQQPDSTWIAQPKCHLDRQKDQKMLKIMCGAGC